MKAKILIPLAGLALFCACKGKSGYEIVNNGSSSAADSAKSDSIAFVGAKLVKTADMQFKVKNVAETAEKIATLTTGFNGMVTHHQMSKIAENNLDVRVSNDSVMRVTSFKTTAEMTVKIPSAKIDEFMSQVAHMGIYVTGRTMDINDKSLDYLSAQLKLRNRSELVNQQKTGKIVIKHPEDVLNLKDDMTDALINNKHIDESVKNSIVSLSFYESNTIYKEIIANDDPSAYNSPFFKRLAMALENGWAMFVDMIIGLANLWVFILAGIGVWMLIRYYQKNKNTTAVKAEA